MSAYVSTGADVVRVEASQYGGREIHITAYTAQHYPSATLMLPPDMARRLRDDLSVLLDGAEEAK